MNQLNNQSILFKKFYVNWDNFKERMEGTSIYNILVINEVDNPIAKDFFNFISNRYDNRRFKWAVAGQIISNVEEKWFDTWYIWIKIDEMIKLSATELGQQSEVGKNFNINNVREQDLPSKLDKFQTIQTEIKREMKDVDPVENIKRYQEIVGTKKYLVKEWAELFLPFITDEIAFLR